MTMSESKIATTPEVLNEVLSYIFENFHAESYGLLMSSHGFGWLPPEYSTKSYTLETQYGKTDTDYDSGQPQKRALDSPIEYHRPEGPRTKGMGVHNYNSHDYTEINIADLAKSIPFKLDYIIFDACFMGCIEVAYELRNIANKIVASQTEILADGMDYPSMCRYIFANEGPDLKGLCQRYYEYYNLQSGWNKSATISLVDCSKLETLAQQTKSIINLHKDGLTNAQNNRNKIQRYFQYSHRSAHQWFYDFEEIIKYYEPSDEELNAFKSSLMDAVIYKASTAYFVSHSELSINHHSGLSMYLPYATGRDYLNDFYKTLEWNKVTGLVE